MPNWREQFDERFCAKTFGSGEPVEEFDYVKPYEIRNFIKSKFSELIDEIPDNLMFWNSENPIGEPGESSMVKQQLRDKWL